MSMVLLAGLRAENPLAFLAALGALSLLDSDSQGLPAQMSWQPHAGTFVATMQRADIVEPEDVAKALVAAHQRRDLTAELGWEKDIMKFTRDEVRQLFKARDDDLDAARMVAACLAELPLRRDGVSAPYTPFRLIPRVGRTRFLQAAMRESSTGIDHIESCLFEDWQYVPGTQSMRWDPGARVPTRALMAEAPTHAKPSGVPGAVLLAMRGLTCFPLIQWRAGGGRRGGRSSLRVSPPGMQSSDRFIWPIWKTPLELSLVRVLLSSRWLYDIDAEERSASPSTAAPTATNNGDEERDRIERRERRRRARRRVTAEAHLRAHGVIARYSAPRVSRGGDDEALGWGAPTFLCEPPA